MSAFIRTVLIKGMGWVLLPQLAWRIVWCHLPYAVNRLRAGEVSLLELTGFVIYLVRADVGAAPWFDRDEAAYRLNPLLVHADAS